MKIRGSAANLLTAVLLLAALGVAGCGSSDAGSRSDVDVTSRNAENPTATRAPGTVPCPLDAARVSSVLGIELARNTSARCGLVASSPKPGQVIEIYHTPIDAMVYEESEGEDVAGVGDGARWDTQMAGSLLVKTGSRYFSIQAVAMGDLPEPLRAKNLAVSVARTVLDGSDR